MPKTKIFEEFAKKMREDGVVLSDGIIYNNLHNTEFFNNVYEYGKSIGITIDKETFRQKLGVGEMKDDYFTYDKNGIKKTPTTPKPTLVPKVVAPTTPKPTTTLKDFTIPSIQQGIATKKELNLSPSPTKSEVVVEDRPIPKVPQLSDIKPIENFSLPTNLPTQTDYRGANFKQPTFDIEPAYSKLSIDDVIADNKTFSNKYSTIYEEESDAKYKLDQSNFGQENKYKYEKSNIDNQYKAIDMKAKQLSYIIGDKFKTKDILVDIEQGNNQINAQLKQFEALKATKDPILKDLQSKMQSLNQAYQTKQIDENAYKAEFAALSAKYEVEANEVNKKGKEINELQANFQSKFNDPDVNNYLKLLKKKYEVSVEGISLIDDPRFTLIKEKEDKYSVKQQRADEKEKLRMSLNSGEITQAEYFKQLKEKGYTDLSTTNTNAFIADKLSDLLKQGLTLPRMAGGIFNNEYGWTDKLADVATSIAESKQKSNPYSSDMAVKSYQKFAQVGDFRVLLDEKGNPYDVRDSKYFSIQPLQAEAILEEYKQSPNNYTKYNQANASVFTKDALSTIADVGIMIAGTKGLGSLVKGGTLANTIIGSGISFAQIQPDIYEQAINSGLNPQHASQLSALVSGGISIIGLINPVESKLAGGGGLFGGASKIALSNADVALINSGKLSVSQIANKYIKGIAKNILGENFEEVIAEPLWQDMISNIYKSQLTENSEGFDKQFDPISHQGLETALLTSVVAIPFGIAEVNQEMPHLQSIALQTAIDNPEVYNQILEQRKEKGLITEVEMGAQMLQMEEISSIYNSVKDEIKKERQPELIALLAKKNVAQNKIAEIKDDVLSTNWKGTLEKINNDIQNILNDKPTVNNLVEVEDLIEEETPITQEKEKPKVFSDFDNTLYDPQTGELTELGEQMKERIANGEDIEIVTAREDTPENRKLIADKLGIDDSKISMGLTPEMKAEKVEENEGKSQFIDDNTENLNAVTELENENIEVVPVVSKGQSAIDKLKARFKPKPIEEEVVTPIAEEAPTVEVAPIVSNETKIAELRQERDDIKLSVNDSVEEATAKINRASEILNEIKALEQQPTSTTKSDTEAKKADIERRKQELEKKYEETKERHLRELEKAGVDLGKWGIAFNDIIHNIEEENNSGNYSKEVEALARKQYEEWWALNREKQEIESDADRLSFSDYNFSNKQSILDRLKKALSKVYQTNRQALDDGFVEWANVEREVASVGGNQYAAHGMGKTTIASAFSDLINLFEKGINPFRGQGALDVATLAGGISDGTTAGGAYMNGAFTLVANRNHNGRIENINQIGGIIVNEGIATPEVLSALKELFPNLVIESTLNSKSLVEQLNAKYDAELKALEQSTSTNQSESNPALSSVESTAKALEGYHYTDKDFSEFEQPTETQSLGNGVYFYLNKRSSNKKEVKADLSVKKILDWKNLSENERNKLAKELEYANIPTERLNNGKLVKKEFDSLEEAQKYTNDKKSQGLNVKTDLVDGKYVVEYKEKGLSTASNDILRGLASEFDPNIAKRLGYDAAKLGDEIVVFDAKNTKIKSESLLSKEQTSVIEEINSKNLTRVEGLGMGMNQAVGTYISTESGNRYETDGNAQKVTVTIKNPLVVTEDIGLIELRNQNANKFVDEFEDIDFDGYENPNKEKLSIEDLSETGLAKLAEITTRELKKQGYDSIYFRESDIQEGELVIFDKQNVTIDGKEQQKSSKDATKQQTTIKGSNQSDKVDSKPIKKRKKGTPRSRRNIKNPEYLKALSLETFGSPYDYVLQYFISGNGYSAELLRTLYGKTKAFNDLSGKAVSMPMGEMRARIGFLNKDGAKSISVLGEILSERYTDEMGIEADSDSDSQAFANIAEDIINSYRSRKDMVETILKRYGLSQTEEYESAFNNIESEYGSDIANEAIDYLSELTDDEIKEILLNEDGYYNSQEFQDYLNNAPIEPNDSNEEIKNEKQKEKNKRTKVEIKEELKAKESELSKLKAKLAKQVKSFTEYLKESQINLYEDNKTQSLFDNKAEQQKIVEQTKREVEKKQNEVNEIQEELDNINQIDIPFKSTLSEETTTPQDKKEVSKIIEFFNKMFGFDGFAPFSEFNAKLKSLGYSSLQAMVASSRGSVPKVRGGWTKEKIVKYLKSKSSDSKGSYGIIEAISSFDNFEDFKNSVYYHGTSNAIEGGLKPSITMSEREAERNGGGGYGERYFGISLTKRKRTAESFSGQSRSVTVYPVILKKDANVIVREDLQDASEIEDIIVELYEQGVDAVWIGGGEQELVVINPASAILYKKGSDSYQVYGGFKSENPTDAELKSIYDKAKKDYPKLREELKTKFGKDDRNEFLNSVEKIQFLKTPSGKVLGFVSDGKIYLNPNALTAKTAFHELAHVQQALIKIASQKGDAIAKAVMQRWDRLMKDNDVIGQVRKFSKVKSKGTPTQFSITMPDGSTNQIQTINEDVVNGFYSPLEKIISETKFDKLPAKQWIEKFAKGEEAKWTGLTEWLNSQTGSVSKADIQAYLKDNRISVVEVVKGSYSKQVDELYKKLEAKNKGREFDDWDVKDQDEWMAKRGEPQETKFSQYQLEGEKENYKEVLVTLPQSRQQKEINRLAEKYGVENTYTALRQSKATDSELEVVRGLKNDQFKSSHFDEPNILVHLRMNTRTDADGKKVLFLEEVQSDWGQKGKKDGFVEKIDKNNIQNVREDENVWVVKFDDGSFLDISKKEAKNADEAKALALQSKKERFVGGNSKIPTAPFVTDTNSWTKLGLKVALKEAVKQGADKIAWTTGEQQNDRYDLSKQVDYIQHEDGFGETKYVDISTPNGLITFQVDKRGKILENKNQQVPESIGKNLADVIGKDITERILNSTKSGRIEGDGLKVGGKGMKGFYGSPAEKSLGIVGNVAKSLFKQEPKTLTLSDGSEYMYQLLMDGKKWDEYGSQESLNEVKKELIDSGIDSKRLSENKRFLSGRNEDLYKSTQHSIDITPELKSQVEQGQALFQAEGDGKRVIKIADTNKTHEIDLSATVYDQAENESDADYEERIMNEVWSYLTDAKNAKLWTEATKGGKIRNFINAVANFFKRKLGLKGMTVDEIMNSDLKTLIERTANSLMKGEWFELQKEKQAKTQPYFNYDPTNEEHVEDNDIINEYIDAVVEDGRIPTIEEFKADIGGEVFDNIIDKLGLPFIEGKFNDTTIKDLVLENLSKKQKASPLVKRGQATLGEESRTLFDEIGRTYTSDKWKEIEPQVDAFVQRILGSKDFSGSVRELMQWMKEMPIGAYLNEDGLATAHTMILNKLVMHSYALDKELFMEVFKFAKIRGTSFGQAIAAYAEASTPESLFNNAIGDLEMEKENILDTIQPSGLTLKEELDNILEQITIKADEITSVLDAIDEKTQKTVTKTKGKRKSTGTTTTPSAVAPRSTEQKKKAKERIDKAKSRLGDWLQKQGIVKFAYNPQDDLNAHIELLSISKELVLGYLEYGYASALKLKEKLQEAIGKNINVDDIWISVYDEEVRSKVKEVQVEVLEKAILSALSDGNGKQQDMITQLAGLLRAEANKLMPKKENKTNVEEKVKLLFENKELSKLAWENALKKGLAQIESSNLTDEQKAERKKALEDAIGNFVTVPNSVSRKAIQVGLKDLKETIEDIAKMHFTEASNVVETLVDKLVMEAGLSHADAVEYAKILTNEINKQLKDKKVKLLDKLLNTKSRKVVKLTELEKIINAVNLGALSSSDFSNLFAKKFGFKAITPEQIQYLHDTINLMFETNGIMRRRMAQKLADYIDSMKPLWDARAFWRLIQNVVHQHALNGANTYGNIVIGSTASVVSNLLGSLALNFNAFKRANKAYNKAKLKGTGTYAAIDTMWTGYNDMHNFTTEENFVEKGSRYHKWVNKWGYKSVSDFLLLLYKPIAQLGYFASAFDNIVNHRGGEILNYIAEYNALDKKGMSIQDIYDLVEKKMGYADADMFSQQVDEEIQDYKANGIKIPIGFKEQRLKELMISHRDKERQLKAYETVRTFGLMGKPDGLSGSLYDFLKPASIIQDTDSNLTAHMKGIYSTTIALFLRISFASAGAVINSTPILGFFAGAYRIEKNEETKKREFRRATGREYAHTAVMQTASIASLVFGFMAMFDLEDDENGKTIISLDPDRLIDISGTNIEFFDQEKLRLDNGQYKSLSIRFRTSKDSKWGPFREVGKYLPFAVPNMAILGNLRDRILIKQEDNKEDDLKQIYPNPKEVLNSLLSIGGGLQVASYNSLAQFISKASAIASYKNNSPEIQAEKKMQDAAKLAYNTITRPAKTILQTNLHRDITKSIAALANSQKKSDNIYMNVFKDFYGFDPFINHKELDIFGNKAMKIVPVLDKDERYNMPEWKLLREKNIVFDPPYFYKTGTFDGEKVKITNDERLMLNDRVSVEFGNLIRENLNELKTMTQLELLQEFRMYATLAKAEVTLMKYEDAIKPIDYEKAVKRFD